MIQYRITNNWTALFPATPRSRLTSAEDIAAKANARLLGILPKVKRMTGAEARKAGGWIVRAADGVGDDQIIGDVKTDEQVIALLDTQ